MDRSPEYVLMWKNGMYQTNPVAEVIFFLKIIILMSVVAYRQRSNKVMLRSVTHNKVILALLDATVNWSYA